MGFEVVGDRLREVVGRIESACARSGRAAGAVRLVAVSKRQPDEALRAAYEAGARDFGENYPQELVRKRAELGLADARWHLIGHLQSNKAKLAAAADVVHSIDSAKVADAIARTCGEGERKAVLVQVNISAEASKSGAMPDVAHEVLAAARALPALDVRGLMTLPAKGHGRAGFAALRELRDQLLARYGGELPELSMGMSEDFEDAILEGSTIVRVGSGIFGARPATAPPVI